MRRSIKQEKDMIREGESLGDDIHQEKRIVEKIQRFVKKYFSWINGVP